MARRNDQPWPDNELEVLTACPVCDSDDVHLLYEGMRDWNFGCAKGEWSRSICAKCFSSFLNPRPTRASIGKAYSQYYTHGEGQALAGGDLSLRQKVRSAIANDYRNWRYGLSQRPAIPGGRLVGKMLPEMTIGTDIEYGYLPRRSKGIDRVLEIGPGGGNFLRRIRDAGWIASAVEPDPVSAAKLRADDFMIYLDICELSDQEGQYRAVVSSHSIEHVHDPKSVLAKAFRLLSPGGHLFIDTPNLGSIGHRQFGKFWQHLDAPRHLVLFSAESLSRLLGEIGFEAIVQHRRPDVPLAESFANGSPSPSGEPLTPQNIGPVAFAALFGGSERAAHEYLTVTAKKPLG